METLQVALGRRSYPIYIGGGLLEQAAELLRPLGVGRWAIVCDDTVAALYGAPLARRTGWPLVTFPAGEGSKSLEEYDRLCRRLVQLGLTRSDGIVALGGRVHWRGSGLDLRRCGGGGSGCLDFLRGFGRRCCGRVDGSGGLNLGGCRSFFLLRFHYGVTFQFEFCRDLHVSCLVGSHRDHGHLAEG